MIKYVDIIDNVAIITLCLLLTFVFLEVFLLFKYACNYRHAYYRNSPLTIPIQVFYTYSIGGYYTNFTQWH